MSNGGDRDDDIDKLVRELRRTNQRIDELTKAITAGIRGPEEEGEGQDQIDLWREGQASRTIRQSSDLDRDVRAYITGRARAAQSNSTLAPTYMGDNRVEFYWEVFKRGGEHIRQIDLKMNRKEFKDFMQLLAVHHGADQRLVDILDPGPSMFGVVRDSQGNMSLTVEQTHISWLGLYNNFWYGLRYTRLPNDTQLMLTGEGDIDLSELYPNPSSTLNLPLPPDIREAYGFDIFPTFAGNSDIIQRANDAYIDMRVEAGLTDPRFESYELPSVIINTQMAEAVDRRPDLELTDELRRDWLDRV